MLADGLLAITIASDCRTDSQLAVSKRQPSIRACCAIQSHQGRPRRGWAGRRLSAGGCNSFSSMPSIDLFEDLAVRGFCREQQPLIRKDLTRATSLAATGLRGSLSLAHASETAQREKLSTYWV